MSACLVGSEMCIWARNKFYGMQMSGILVADDGLSWHESGPMHGLTIRRNTFFNCGEPIINIDAENREYKGTVHKNITIEENLKHISP